MPSAVVTQVTFALIARRGPLGVRRWTEDSQCLRTSRIFQHRQSLTIRQTKLVLPSSENRERRLMIQHGPNYYDALGTVEPFESILFGRWRSARLEHSLRRSTRQTSEAWPHSRHSSKQARRPTSVNSNLTLAVASPSPIAKWLSSCGCPTMDAYVSRCWFVYHSLQVEMSV